MGGEVSELERRRKCGLGPTAGSSRWGATENFLDNAERVSHRYHTSRDRAADTTVYLTKFLAPAPSDTVLTSASANMKERLMVRLRSFAFHKPTLLGRAAGGGEQECEQQRPAESGCPASVRVPAPPNDLTAWRNSGGRNSFFIVAFIAPSGDSVLHAVV